MLFSVPYICSHLFPRKFIISVRKNCVFLTPIILDVVPAHHSQLPRCCVIVLSGMDRTDMPFGREKGGGGGGIGGGGEGWKGREGSR